MPILCPAREHVVMASQQHWKLLVVIQLRYLNWQMNCKKKKRPLFLGDGANSAIRSYGQSSYCGILPVLWDGPLLCSEVVEDKSPIIDVVETYMKLI